MRTRTLGALPLCLALACGSASADGHVKMYHPKAGPAPVLSCACGGQGAETLSVDWSKYDENVFTSASTAPTLAITPAFTAPTSAFISPCPFFSSN